MNETSSLQSAFLKKHRQHHHLVLFLRLLGCILFLGLWEISTRLSWIDSFIFSCPSGILKTLAVMSGDGSLFLHTKVTLYETLVSFLLVIGISFLTATLLWIFPTVSEILEPWLVVLNSLPKSALAPLLIVWLEAALAPSLLPACLSLSLAALSTCILHFGRLTARRSSSSILLEAANEKLCAM